jgi:hypothetical protein
MPREVTGPGIPAGLAENPVIARFAVLLTFERLAALRWPRERLSCQLASI